jgi:catechol 2,3-dioxygenase-like lactoylglutathione lyase family enzyme
MSEIMGIHHASLLVADTARALAFYRDLLGLAVIAERPDLGFPGAWLRVGSQQIHLLELPSPDPLTAGPTMAGGTGTSPCTSRTLRRWPGVWKRPAFPTAAAARAGPPSFAGTRMPMPWSSCRPPAPRGKSDGSSLPPFAGEGWGEGPDRLVAR